MARNIQSLIPAFACPSTPKPSSDPDGIPPLAPLPPSIRGDNDFPPVGSINSFHEPNYNPSLPHPPSHVFPLQPHIQPIGPGPSSFQPPPASLNQVTAPDAISSHHVPPRSNRQSSRPASSTTPHHASTRHSRTRSTSPPPRPKNPRICPRSFNPNHRRGPDPGCAG